MVGEICPLCLISLQLGRCHQGRPENQNNYAQEWKKKVRFLDKRVNKKAKWLNMIYEWMEEKPCQIVARWKGAICWSASSRNPHLSWSHAGTAPLLSSLAPCFLLLFQVQAFSYRKNQPLRRPRAYAVVATYYSQDAPLLSSIQQLLVATYPAAQKIQVFFLSFRELAKFQIPARSIYTELNRSLTAVRNKFCTENTS